MRALLARWLRAVADRLARHDEVDALRLDVRRLQGDLAHQRRLTREANSAAERAYAERDRAWQEAALWHGTVDDCNRVIALQGAAAARRSVAEVHRPVFGRRTPPPHLRPVD